MNEFYNSLKGVEKVMYKSAFNFHLKYTDGATDESAHQAGLDELERLKRLKEEASKPTTYVDLSTGKTFVSNQI